MGASCEAVCKQVGGSAAAVCVTATLPQQLSPSAAAPPAPHLEEARVEEREVLHKRLLLVGAGLVRGRQVGGRRQDGHQLAAERAVEAAKVRIKLGRHRQAANLRSAAARGVARGGRGVRRRGGRVQQHACASRARVLTRCSASVLCAAHAHAAACWHSCARASSGCPPAGSAARRGRRGAHLSEALQRDVAEGRLREEAQQPRDQLRLEDVAGRDP